MERRWLWSSLLVSPIFFLGGSQVFATEMPLISSFTTYLNGYREVPPTFTTGAGSVKLKISSDSTSISYVLTYSGLSSDVIQAYITSANGR
jgi:hypothetical protein